jgi:hypothetical protein
MKFEIGQLVRNSTTRDIGIVKKVDADYYGARQALKVYKAQRGQTIGPWSVNGIGPTKDGIRDRILVRWYTDYENGGYTSLSYEDGNDIEPLEGDNGV